jgi:hypothetical protein
MLLRSLCQTLRLSYKWRLSGPAKSIWIPTSLEADAIAPALRQLI